MADYKYVAYETARRRHDRPDHAQPSREPERAEPRPARGARRRVPASRGRRHRARRHPRRRGADVLVGPRHGLEGVDRGAHARARPAPDVPDQRRHAQGRREADAAGVALLLREHEAVAEPAQDHDRAGARHRLRRRAHAHVGVRSDRRRRRRALLRRRRHPARHVRRGVLRPPVGVRSAQDQGADAHGRRHRRGRGAPARHGEQDLPDRRARRPHARVRPPHRRAAHDDRAAHQGVGEPERRQHGLPERARRRASRCTS